MSNVFNIVFYTNSSFKGLYLYSIISPLISGTKNTSRIEFSIPRELPILFNIYSNILVL
jgi:hypothetical protein